MGDGYDRFENDNSGGGSFVMGLLTGTVLGAGLGMLFAPKAGSELRSQLSDQAGTVANTATEGYRRATEAAGEWADKGKQAATEWTDKGKQAATEWTDKGKQAAGEWADKGKAVYDKARDAVSKGADEAERYVRESTGDMPGASPSMASSGASASGSSSGSSYGSSAEHPHGSGTKPSGGSSSGGSTGGPSTGGSSTGGSRRS